MSTRYVVSMKKSILLLMLKYLISILIIFWIFFSILVHILKEYFCHSILTFEQNIFNIPTCQYCKSMMLRDKILLDYYTEYSKDTYLILESRYKEGILKVWKCIAFSYCILTQYWLDTHWRYTTYLKASILVVSRIDKRYGLTSILLVSKKYACQILRVWCSRIRYF